MSDPGKPRFGSLFNDLYPKVNPVDTRFFWRRVLLPILLLWGLYFLYTRLACRGAGRFETLHTLCGEGGRAAFLLCASYSLVKFLSPFLGWVYILQRVGYTLLVYSLVYGGLDWPLWLAGMLQPLPGNTFLHVLALIVALDTWAGWAGEPDPE